jgi:hypothetical protein
LSKLADISPASHTSPHLITVIHLALAATHLVIMKCYDGESKRPHAFCAGLSAVLYLFLAGLHVVAG